MTPKSYSEILKDLEKEIQASKGELSDMSVHMDLSRTKSSTEAEIKLQGLMDYFEMRRAWGNFLKWCLGIILAFNIVLVFAVGFGVLQYKDEWFLRVVLTTNLADIIGLVFLVVKFLFSEQNKDSSTPSKSK